MGLKIPVSAVQVRLWPPANVTKASPLGRGFRARWAAEMDDRHGAV